jgi:hypothetical protein
MPKPRAKALFVDLSELVLEQNLLSPKRFKQELPECSRRLPFPAGQSEFTWTSPPPRTG